MGKHPRENRGRERAMQASFKKRKACILKKTMELSVLCDLQACAVIIDDDGEVTTWPKNQCEVMKILQGHRACSCDTADYGMEKNSVPDAFSTDDPPEWNDAVLEDLLNEPWQQLFNACIGGGGDVDIMNNDDDQRLLVEVDSKLHAVMERIEFLKSAGGYETPPLLLEYHPDQSSIRMVPTPGSYEVKSEIDATQIPDFSESSSNQQQSTFYVPATPGPSELQYVVETIQDHPCFSVYASDQHRILEMATKPGFFKEVAEQGFPDMMPLFLADGSEQKMLHMVPELGYFGEIPEHFDPQLCSMNWNYDLFSFNGY